MGDRKVCITLKGKFSAKIADGTLPADLNIIVKDDVGESLVEVIDQENRNIKMGKKGAISGDTKIQLTMTVDDSVEVGDAISELSFSLEDSNPRSKRVQHGWSMVKGFKFELLDWEITDSK